MVDDARNTLFDRPSGIDQRAQRHRKFLFDEHAQHAERVATQREGILFTRRHLTDAEEPRQSFHLVGERHGKAHGGRG